MPDPLHIREYEPGDEEAILATYNRVFAELDPSFEPRSLEAWRWQYLENPSGRRIFLALDSDGRVVAQYAGIAQRVRLRGEPAFFSHSVDSMSDPSYRAGLRRPGLFVRTGRPYAARYGGPEPARDALMWGLPVPAAWRIGQRFLGYRFLSTPLLLELAPDRLGRPCAGTEAGLTLERVDTLPDSVNALFERFAAEHGALTVRDVAHLSWRYVRHPSRRYELALVQDSAGAARGLAVYRSARVGGREAGIVCDWMVPEEECAAADMLTDWLAGRARADGAPRLCALVPPTRTPWRQWQARGFRAVASEWVVAVRSYRRSLARPWLWREWYWTLGDTDLV